MNKKGDKDGLAVSRLVLMGNGWEKQDSDAMNKHTTQ
jgi:hypothetical protein